MANAVFCLGRVDLARRTDNCRFDAGLTEGLIQIERVVRNAPLTGKRCRILRESTGQRHHVDIVELT